MIQNFLPTSALLAIAPGVTAVIYTGDGSNPVETTDLALGVESGDVIPLTGHGDKTEALLDVATLLQCSPNADIFEKVIALATLLVIQELSGRSKQNSLVKTKPQPRSDPMSGSMEALLAAMDAAEAARTV